MYQPATGATADGNGPREISDLHQVVEGGLVQRGHGFHLGKAQDAWSAGREGTGGGGPGQVVAPGLSGLDMRISLIINLSKRSRREV